MSNSWEQSNWKDWNLRHGEISQGLVPQSGQGFVYSSWHSPAEPLTNKFQPCLLSSLSKTEIYEKLKLCGRHLSQALTTRRSHPPLFGLLKLNNSSVCYVYYGNAVTSDELAKQHIAVKHWTVILPGGMVVSSSVPSHCRFVSLCPQKLFWRNMWSSLARSI